LNATADLTRLCVHQVTLMAQCDFRRSVECSARNGITKTAVWRDKFDAIGVPDAASILRDHGVEAVALCPGGLPTHRGPASGSTDGKSGRSPRRSSPPKVSTAPSRA
jgi:hypothetical protein